MLLLQNAKDYRVKLDDECKDSILYNYYRYVSSRNLPYCYQVRVIDGSNQATIFKDGDGEIIIQPETIARMLHELSEDNFNNYINVLIHEYYGER